jgi:hypothetical protein
MYPFVKYIVCAILLLINPIVAVILFIGWVAFDINLAKAVAKDQFSTEAIKQLATFRNEFFWISFQSMMTPRGPVRRTNEGVWEYKYSSEKQTSRWKTTKALIEYQGDAENYDCPDCKDGEDCKDHTHYLIKELSEIETNAWSPFHDDYQFSIEHQYQVYVKSVVSVVVHG